VCFRLGDSPDACLLKRSTSLLMILAPSKSISSFEISPCLFSDSALSVFFIELLIEGVLAFSLRDLYS